MASSTSPGFSSSLAQVEKAPPSTRLMPTWRIALALAGADRVAAAQLVVVELAAEGQVLALREVEEGGVLVARLQGDDDGVARLACGRRRHRGNGSVPCRCLRVRSDALEVVEGLEAVVAAVARLAGRRAELADLLGVGRAAARAGDGEVAAGESG